MRHTGKARIQGTTENSQTGHCTLTAESADVKTNKTFNMGNNITCIINRKYRTAATLCTVERGFVSDIRIMYITCSEVIMNNNNKIDLCLTVHHQCR